MTAPYPGAAAGTGPATIATGAATTTIGVVGASVRGLTAMVVEVGPCPELDEPHAPATTTANHAASARASWEARP